MLSHVFWSQVEYKIVCFISYNYFTQSVILNVKNNVETTFKLRVSNMLARSLGLNITLDFPKNKNVAKVSN